MKTTHYLQWNARDNDCHNGECLSDLNTAFQICYSILSCNKGQRFFMRLVDIANGKDESISGFSKDGNCYYIE